MSFSSLGCMSGPLYLSQKEDTLSLEMAFLNVTAIHSDPFSTKAIDESLIVLSFEARDRHALPEIERGIFAKVIVDNFQELVPTGNSIISWGLPFPSGLSLEICFFKKSFF